MDPPRQLKSRKIVRATFTPRAVDSYEARFREHARNIVDRVASRGECEFVEEVAAELPLLAILELCGIPPEDRKDFFEWTNTMMFNQDPEMSADPEDADGSVLQGDRVRDEAVEPSTRTTRKTTSSAPCCAAHSARTRAERRGVRLVFPDADCRRQ